MIDVNVGIINVLWKIGVEKGKN